MSESEHENLQRHLIRVFLSVWSLHAVLAVENEGDNPIDWLKNSIPGEPGVDYPIMASVAETSFTCDGLIFGGYYADPETQCQQYSVCLQVREWKERLPSLDIEILPNLNARNEPRRGHFVPKSLLAAATYHSVFITSGESRPRK